VTQKKLFGYCTRTACDGETTKTSHNKDFEVRAIKKYNSTPLNLKCFLSIKEFLFFLVCLFHVDSSNFSQFDITLTCMIF